MGREPEPEPEIPWKQTHLSNLIKGYQLLWMFSPLQKRPQDYNIKSAAMAMEQALHSVKISRVYELSVLRCYDEFKWLLQSQLSYRNVVSLCQDSRDMLREPHAHLDSARVRLWEGCWEH